MNSLHYRDRLQGVAVTMLQALSISRSVFAESLHPGLEGTVHSVFASACNLLCEGRLIGLVSPLHGNGPDAIVVEPPSGGFAAADAWQPGAVVRLVGRRLMLSGGGGVHLAGAAHWDPEPACPPARGDFAAGADELGRSLGRLAPAGGIAEPVLALWEERSLPGGLMAAAVPRLASLREACQGKGDRSVAGAAATLVGLGPGLTPSGDDFLAGLTATLVRAGRWGMAADRPAGAALSLAGFLADGCVGRTTLPSVTLLRSAARGWLTEAASDLATGLLGGRAGALAHLPKVLALGHTSGADTASGMYMALRLLAEVPG